MPQRATRTTPGRGTSCITWRPPRAGFGLASGKECLGWRYGMTVDSKGRELFIVDNSVSGWTGLRYLEEWSGIAKSFDIATGYFEIGALLALDGKWQPLEKIRILMGAEMTHRTRKAPSRCRPRAGAEDPRRQHRGRQGCKPLPARRSGDPRGLRSGRSSAAFTTRTSSTPRRTSPTRSSRSSASQAWWDPAISRAPGLTENIELNVQIQSGREVAQLQEWYEEHWNEATEVTDAVHRDD